MTVQLEFNQDVNTIYKALTDPQFLIDRNLALGELSSECDVEESKQGATVNAVREVRRDFPGVLSKLFDPVNVMDMEETWMADGSGWKGNWTMAVRGQPVTILGNFTLAPHNGGCRYSVSHQARVNVPFVGRQVEKYILGQTAKGASDELEYLRSYLEDNGT
jgi:hypothetical protein